jgi:hypothetical protein
MTGHNKKLFASCETQQYKNAFEVLKLGPKITPHSSTVSAVYFM